ncbi:molybdopterin-dependent oxidoreductase [Candidatus Latescibacterota bacterium]
MQLPEDQAGVTPVSELFTYHIFGTPKDLGNWQHDIETYRLAVGGLVSSPARLSVREIREDYVPVSADMVLQCMTNVHWGRIHLTGARLLDVLERINMAAGADKLAIHGADGFDTDLWIEDIRRHPAAFLLAYEMNDEPIAADHGFPVRLTADGKYGYKWCKWLSEIEVVDHDYRGHYEGKRRWSDAATRGTKVT